MVRGVPDVVCQCATGRVDGRGGKSAGHRIDHGGAKRRRSGSDDRRDTRCGRRSFGPDGGPVRHARRDVSGHQRPGGGDPRDVRQHAGRQRRLLRGHRGRQRGSRPDRRFQTMLDFAALPPEINSGRMYAGPGPGSMLAAATAWQSLAEELNSVAASYGSILVDVDQRPLDGCQLDRRWPRPPRRT